MHTGSITVALKSDSFAHQCITGKKKIKSTNVRLRFPKKAGENASYFFILVRRKSEACMNLMKAD